MKFGIILAPRLLTNILLLSPLFVLLPRLQYNTRMLILALDTSSRVASVALLADTEVLAVVSSDDARPSSERLFNDLRLLRTQVSFEMDRIDLLAVANGPGSFTGLRVGLAAAKAIAEVHGKPLAAASVLEAIAAQADGGVPIVAPFQTAGRGQFYAALYRRPSDSPMDLRLVNTEAVLSPEELLLMATRGIGGAPACLISPAPQTFRESCADVTPPIATASPILAPVIGRLGLARALRGLLLDPLQLDANYVRRSGAAGTWKDLA